MTAHALISLVLFGATVVCSITIAPYAVGIVLSIG